jgi:hypothetical protein
MEKNAVLQFHILIKTGGLPVEKCIATAQTTAERQPHNTQRPKGCKKRMSISAFSYMYMHYRYKVALLN